MDSLLKAVPNMGETALLMAIIICVVYAVLKHIDKLPNKRDEAMTNTLNKIADSMTAHTERSNTHQALMIENFSRVVKDHEKFLENQMAILQILCSQNDAISSFKISVSKIDTEIDKVNEKVTNVHAKCSQHDSVLR